MRGSLKDIKTITTMEQAKVSTTIEQGERLMSLGIDPDTTADMEWKRLSDGDDYKVGAINGKYHKGLFSDRYKYTRPAWSLEALIGLMPESIEVSPNKWWGTYDFRILKDRIEYFGDDDNFYQFMLKEHNGSMIDTAVAIIEFLVENGYMKPKEETKKR